MKKSILLIASVMMAFSSFAGGNETNKTLKKGEGVLSNGFYLNLGVAFTNTTHLITKLDGKDATGVSASTYSQGIQPHLEIGNQFYFWHNDNVGIGLKVSWLQFGYSAYSLSSLSSSIKNSQYGNFNVKLLKLAPQFTYAVNKDLAFDAYFEFAPTANIGAGVNQYSAATVGGNGYDITSTYVGFGLTMAPGIRVRYKVFALGFDYGFGVVNNAETYSYSSGYPYGSFYKPSTGNSTDTYSSPRVYLGFQF